MDEQDWIPATVLLTAFKINCFNVSPMIAARWKGTQLITRGV